MENIEKKVVKLQYPIKTDKKTIDEVELQSPIVKRMLAMDTVGGDMAKQVALVSAFTGLSSSQVEIMHISDFATIKREVDSFLKPTT